MKTLMVRCVTEVTFQQITGGRSLSFSMDFVNEFSASDSWAELTNKATIKIPKNIYVKNKQNVKIPLGGTQAEKRISRLFQRGDAVSISYGYYTYENGKERLEMSKVFTGYISGVISKKPVTIECEDNMWLLKQIQCKAQAWPKEKTVEDLFRQLLSGTSFTVNATTKTTVGNLIIENETVAQLISRLRKDYHLEAYFRGSELRIGSLVYIENEAKKHTFEFQKNIISDNLKYQRRDDVKLSAICKSINLQVQTGKTKDGRAKTKNKKLEVLVYSDETGNFKHMEAKNGSFPENIDGERRTLFIPNAKTVEELAEAGINELKKYYYDGFKGDFTTFAIPFVRMGDNVLINDPILPDRNGLYKVRSVRYTGGVSGHRQIISLDYKIQ